MAAPLDGIKRVIHCDWSRDPKKRWSATADRIDSQWQLSGPRRVEVGNDGDLLTAVKIATGPDDCTLVAFDFPLGVPAAWGAMTGVSDFTALLPQLGSGQWEAFFDVANTGEEISITRPFYPDKTGEKGSTSRETLWKALAMEPAEGLRACERPLPGVHSGASPLFWTLGGKQVGKAALSGWALLQTPVERGECVLWPFAGELDELVRPGQVIIAESYPGAYYAPLGGPQGGTGWSKRNQDDRKALFADVLLAGKGAWGPQKWRAGATFTPELRDAISDGFCPKSIGEDQFDAVVGLMGVLDGLEATANWAPADPGGAIRMWEGWILGLRGKAT